MIEDTPVCVREVSGGWDKLIEGGKDKYQKLSSFC